MAGKFDPKTGVTYYPGTAGYANLTPTGGGATTPTTTAPTTVYSGYGGKYATQAEANASIQNRTVGAVVAGTEVAIAEPEPTPEPTISDTAPILKVADTGEKSIFDPSTGQEHFEGTVPYQQMLTAGKLRTEGRKAHDVAIAARESLEPTTEEIIIGREIEAAGFEPSTGEPLPFQEGPISPQVIEAERQERQMHQEALLEMGILEEAPPSFTKLQAEYERTHPEPSIFAPDVIPQRSEKTPRMEFEERIPLMPDEPIIDVRVDLFGKGTLTFSEEMGLLPFMKGIEKTESLLGTGLSYFRGEDVSSKRYKVGEFVAGLGKTGLIMPLEALPPLIYSTEQLTKREIKALTGDEKAMKEVSGGIGGLYDTLGLQLYGRKERRRYTTRGGTTVVEPEIPGMFTSIAKTAEERPEYFVGGVVGAVGLLGAGKGIQKVKIQKSKVDVATRAIEAARAERPIEIIPTGKKTPLETELAYLTGERKIEFGIQTEPVTLTKTQLFRALETDRPIIEIGTQNRINIIRGEKSIHTHPIDSTQNLKEWNPTITNKEIKELRARQEFFSEGDIASFITTGEREAVLITSTGKKITLKEGKHFTPEKWDTFLERFEFLADRFDRLSNTQKKKILREAGLSIKETKIKTTPEAEFKKLTTEKVTRVEKVQTFLGLEGGIELGIDTIMGSVAKTPTEAVALSKALKESSIFSLAEKVEIAPTGKPSRVVGKTVREGMGLLGDEPIIDYMAYDPYMGIEARLTVMGKERAASKLRRAKLAKAGEGGEIIEIEALAGAPEGILIRRTQPIVGPEGRGLIITEETPPIWPPKQVGGYFEVGEMWESFGFGFGALKGKPKPRKGATGQVGELQRKIIGEEPMIIRVPRTGPKAKPIVTPVLDIFQEPILIDLVEQETTKKQEPKPIIANILGLAEKYDFKQTPLLISTQKQAPDQVERQLLLSLPKPVEKGEPSLLGNLGYTTTKPAPPPPPKPRKEKAKKAKKKPGRKRVPATRATPSLLGLALGIEEKDVEAISLKGITGIGIRGTARRK